MREGAAGNGREPGAARRLELGLVAEQDGAVAAPALLDAGAEGNEVFVEVDDTALDGLGSAGVVAALIERHPAASILL